MNSWSLPKLKPETIFVVESHVLMHRGKSHQQGLIRSKVQHFVVNLLYAIQSNGAVQLLDQHRSVLHSQRICDKIGADIISGFMLDILFKEESHQ